MAPQLSPAFQHKQYLFRRKFFKFLGGAFHVYDESGNVVLYSKQKAFKLREDLRVYADESQTKELLTIKTPQILDFGATYHVNDAVSGTRVGSLKRKGLKSIIHDEWVLLSPEGREIATLSEKSTAAALLSRLINIIPQTYLIRMKDGREVASLHQHFNPFVLKYTMTLGGGDSPVDRRLLISAGILLAAIERRQR